VADPSESILVLTTGGTIDKLYFDALSSYQVGESVVARLLSIARVTHPFHVEEVMRKDSLEIDDGDRSLIAHHVANADASRIVITHGTDTMTTTARSLTNIKSKTIVLVGSLAPARFAESDAAFNLGMAFATAQIGNSGVYITMNGSVFREGDVIKDRRQGAFVSHTAAAAIHKQ
jgi:L-asparaginase